MSSRSRSFTPMYKECKSGLISTIRTAWNLAQEAKEAKILEDKYNKESNVQNSREVVRDYMKTSRRSSFTFVNRLWMEHSMNCNWVHITRNCCISPLWACRVVQLYASGGGRRNVTACFRRNRIWCETDDSYNCYGCWCKKHWCGCKCLCLIDCEAKCSDLLHSMPWLHAIQHFSLMGSKKTLHPGLHEMPVMMDATTAICTRDTNHIECPECSSDNIYF